MNKQFVLFCALVGVIFFDATGFTQSSPYLENDPQSLPPSLISISSSEGVKRLKNAEALADYQSLAETYQAQRYASYCV